MPPILETEAARLGGVNRENVKYILKNTLVKILKDPTLDVLITENTGGGVFVKIVFLKSEGLDLVLTEKIEVLNLATLNNFVNETVKIILITGRGKYKRHNRRLANLYF